MSAAEPLSEGLEAKLQTAIDDVLITPPPGMSYRKHRESILRAFAREIQEPYEKEREDAARRMRLAVKALMRATGRTQRDVEEGPLTCAIAHADQVLASQESAKALAEALDRRHDLCCVYPQPENYCMACGVLAAYRASEAGRKP